MKKENTYGAVVERGEILSASSDTYTVLSLDRDGIVTLPTTTVGLETYAVGDLVYFFVFADGTGRILSKADQSAKVVPDGAITPEKISENFITDLTENTSGADTDLLVVGNRGTAAMRRFTLANLATYIRDKLASLTFSTLNTSSKTLPGAINELNNNLTYANFTDLVNWTNGTPTSGANGFYRYGKICIVSIDFTSPSSVSTDAIVATLPSGYQASARFPFLVFPAWQANKTNICHVWYGNIVLAGSAWTANTRYVGQAVYIIQ